jgi:hypothetical protein
MSSLSSGNRILYMVFHFSSSLSVDLVSFAGSFLVPWCILLVTPYSELDKDLAAFGGPLAAFQLRKLCSSVRSGLEWHGPGKRAP